MEVAWLAAALTPLGFCSAFQARSCAAPASGGRAAATGGVAFRRQVVIGRLIADVVCPSQRLVIEVDGGLHAARARLDAQRDAHLRRAGYRVLRIPAGLVASNLPAAVALVRAAP